MIIPDRCYGINIIQTNSSRPAFVAHGTALRTRACLNEWMPMASAHKFARSPSMWGAPVAFSFGERPCVLWLLNSIYIVCGLWWLRRPIWAIVHHHHRSRCRGRRRHSHHRRRQKAPEAQMTTADRLASGYPSKMSLRGATVQKNGNSWTATAANGIFVWISVWWNAAAVAGITMPRCAIQANISGLRFIFQLLTFIIWSLICHFAGEEENSEE